MVLERYEMGRNIEGMAKRLMEKRIEVPHKLHPNPQLARCKGSAFCCTERRMGFRLEKFETSFFLN